MYLVIFILVVHFLADFVLQTDDQAKNKSISIKWLTYHTGMYSVIWFLFTWCLYQNVLLALLFSFITFVVHTITDYITSRISKSLFSKGDTHNGFITIGFDQVLHYIQLLLTFEYLNYLTA